jgi:pimeloyl-ACP methyl ester carboxylesterase
VVLEAGLRSRGDYWMPTDETRGTSVVAGVARVTRVCILDRPGTTLGLDQFSRSDPVPMPRTAGDAVADLHALLRAARVPGPYVLAGHSPGGLIVRLYASTYPRQVAGLVQVDALNEFLQREFTPAQTAAFDDLNNGPLPGLEDYKDLEQIRFLPSFVQMRRAKRAHPLPRCRSPWSRAACPPHRSRTACRLGSPPRYTTAPGKRPRPRWPSWYPAPGTCSPDGASTTSCSASPA